jgi:hypothetical protein
MFGCARLLATRPCAGPGFHDRQSSEAGPHRRAEASQVAAVPESRIGGYERARGEAVFVLALRSRS